MMKNIRWQLLIIFLTGIIVGFLLLLEQPTSTRTSPEAVQGGTYIEALIGQPQRLNPVLDFNNQVDRDVDRLIYSGLLKFDDRGLPLPDLAEAWGVSADGLTYNFQLRGGIKFHDGQTLTSEDVIFTIELLREGGTVVPADLQAFWSQVEVRKLADLALSFTLPEPFAPFTDYLTFGVLPKHLLGHLTFDQIMNDPFNLAPIGTGPYRYQNLIMEGNAISGVSLAINQDYYGQPAYIEQIVFKYYPDENAAFNAFTKDEVQGLNHIGSNLLNEALRTENLNITTSATPQLTLVFMNLADPQLEFFQDQSVRKALSTGINRNRLVSGMLQGQAIIADSPIMPGSWAYYDGLVPTEYDPDTAAAMLKAAGYVVTGETAQVRAKDGIELRFELIYPETDRHRMIAEAIRDDMQALNVVVTLVPLSYSELVDNRLASRSYQAALVDVNMTRYPDPDPYVFWDKAQVAGGQNYSQWDNRSASEYLEQARTTRDINERARLYRNFQVIFNEQTPSLLLYYSVYSYGIKRDVRGVTVGPLFDPSDRFQTVTDWYLVSKIPAQAQVQATPSE